ncbi:BAG family molecular chaperone regulator 4 isoform X1 [Ascaphus truei]|uniref:BAG family molecular chaperone regulator 4 isoform X1 n=1 Tax=Ascaphus truei TaxID=8439 RepID=UPI003F5AC179
MSGAHRPVAGGGGGYYAGGDVQGRQRDEAPRQQPQQEAAWNSGYYPQEAGGGAAGAQNQPYHEYTPNYWSSSEHARPPPYSSNYPVRGEMQGQRMEPYTNGSYGPSYPQASMNPPYPGLHPPNPYYPPPPQPPYPIDSYKPAGGAHPAPPNWGYPQQSGHSVPPQNMGQPQGSPYYPAHQDPSYPYRDANSGIPQPATPQPRPQEESWGVYGVPNPYPWQAPPPTSHNTPGSHYIAGTGAPWTGGDMQSASYDVKDPSFSSTYNRQRPNQGYNPETSQPSSVSDPKPSPAAHYSASPQMYNKKDPANQDYITRPEEPNPPPDTVSTDPGMKKISQVLEKVEDLETEVDEFVGKKTDMSYRCLEELLTKELLELDSVETGGQESVRQARKEAVKRLQSILERLERKGF